MSKKTDHKRLWRNEKIKTIRLGEQLATAEKRINTLVTMLKAIKDGQVDVKELTIDEKK